MDCKVPDKFRKPIKIIDCVNDEVLKLAKEVFTSKKVEEIYSWKSGEGFVKNREERKSAFVLNGKSIVLASFGVLFDSKYLFGKGFNYTNYRQWLRVGPNDEYSGLIGCEEFEYIHEPTILIGGQNNICHWMWNWLPRVLLAKEVVPYWRECKFIVHEDCSENCIHTLAMFGIAREQLVFQMNNPSTIKVYTNLILPNMYANSEYSLQGIQAVSDTLASVVPIDTDLPTRIYISRKEDGTAAKEGWVKRDCLNENHLLEALKPKGFEIYQLGKLSISEQINLFRNAEFVVGAHGAGLTNLMFSSKNTRYIILNNSTPSPTFFLPSRFFGLKAKAIRCDSVAPEFYDEGNKKDFPFVIDTSTLLREIDRFSVLDV